MTVASGDTLYAISRRTGASVDSIMQANGLTSPSIRIGQRLVIPGGSSGRRAVASRPAAETASQVTDGSGYVVQPGDSLYGIARRHGVKVVDLSRTNGISDPSKLRVGQRLVIPGGALGTAPVRTARAPATTTVDVPQTSYQPAPRATVQQPSSIDPAPRQVARVEPASEPEAVGADDFRWPVRGRIIRPFGPAADGSFNDGIRIAVPVGTDVRAVKDGVVAYAGDELKGYGNLILIRHEDNWVSAYAHNSELMVARGASVSRGQVIAKAGRTGEVDQPQLHFELRQGSQPVDPMLHLASR